MNTNEPEDEDDSEIPEEKEEEKLYDVDPNCVHDIQPLWSGVKCTKCRGWFCY